MLRPFFPLILLLLTVLSSFSQPAKLILATYTYADNNRLANIQPLADYLAAQLGRPVETRSYPTVQAFIADLKAGKVDVALINTFGYLLLATDGNNPMETLAAMEVAPTTRDNYKTMLVAHPSVAIDNAGQLREKAKEYRFLFVAEGSTSGNLVPRMYLNSIGIANPEGDFKGVGYGGNHATTLAQVVEGRADLGAFGSEEYYKLLARDPATKDKVKILWLSDEITLGPLLVKKSLPASLRKKLQKVMLNLHETQPEAFNAVKAGWSEAKGAIRYRAVDDRYYDSFRNLMGNQAGLVSILERFAR
jgi:phosphate/phosphite/phosphonate ABC transporter binding protein